MHILKPLWCQELDKRDWKRGSSTCRQSDDVPRMGEWLAIPTAHPESKTIQIGMDETPAATHGSPGEPVLRSVAMYRG